MVLSSKTVITKILSQLPKYYYNRYYSFLLKWLIAHYNSHDVFRYDYHNTFFFIKYWEFYFLFASLYARHWVNNNNIVYNWSIFG